MDKQNTDLDLEVSYLISRHIAGDITRQESEKLEQWLNDGANRQLFERITSQQTMRSKIARYAEGDVNAAFTSFAARRMKHNRRIRRMRWSAAACLIAALSVSAVLLLRDREAYNPGDTEWIALSGTPKLTLSTGEQVELAGEGTVVAEQRGITIPVTEGGGINYSTVAAEDGTQIFNRLEIPAACEYHFVLSDGTKVWMNAMSTLRYPIAFDPQQRVVEASGEIYLEVEPDPRRPFFVEANGVRVEVTGTAFNVQSYTDENYTEVTLAEGRVRIHAGDEKINLTPGWQLHWDKENGTSEVRRVNVEDYTCWKEGRYVFKSRLLAEVTRVAERWYDIDIVFENPDAANSVFTGVMIKTDSLEEFLHRLEETSAYQCVREGHTVTIR